MVPSAFTQRTMEDGWYAFRDSSGQIRYRLRHRELLAPSIVVYDWGFGAVGQYERTSVLRIQLIAVDPTNTVIEVRGEDGRLETMGDFAKAVPHMDRGFLDRLASPADDVPMLLGWLEGAALAARPSVQQTIHVQGDMVQGDKVTITDSVVSNSTLGGR